MKQNLSTNFPMTIGDIQNNIIGDFQAIAREKKMHHKDVELLLMAYECCNRIEAKDPEDFFNQLESYGFLITEEHYYLWREYIAEVCHVSEIIECHKDSFLWIGEEIFTYHQLFEYIHKCKPKIIKMSMRRKDPNYNNWNRLYVVNRLRDILNKKKAKGDVRRLKSGMPYLSYNQFYDILVDLQRSIGSRVALPNVYDKDKEERVLFVGQIRAYIPECCPPKTLLKLNKKRK